MHDHKPSSTPLIQQAIELFLDPCKRLSAWLNLLSRGEAGLHGPQLALGRVEPGIEVAHLGFDRHQALTAEGIGLFSVS